MRLCLTTPFVREYEWLCPSNDSLALEDLNDNPGDEAEYPKYKDKLDHTYNEGQSL